MAGGTGAGEVEETVASLAERRAGAPGAASAGGGTESGGGGLSAEGSGAMPGGAWAEAARDGEDEGSGRGGGGGGVGSCTLKECPRRSNSGTGLSAGPAAAGAAATEWPSVPRSGGDTGGSDPAELDAGALGPVVVPGTSAAIAAEAERTG